MTWHDDEYDDGHRCILFGVLFALLLLACSKDNYCCCCCYCYYYYFCYYCDGYYQ